MFTLLVVALPARAETAAAFHAALAEAMPAYREAVSYLETGNLAMAAFSAGEADAAWRKLAARFAAPPEGYRGDARWKATLDAVAARLAEGMAKAESNDGAAALAALHPIRAQLAELRRRNGQRTYSDCIDGMNAAMDRLWAYRRTPPDRARPDNIAALKREAQATLSAYTACRVEAPAAMRGTAEFARLFAGAIASLEKLPAAADAGDVETLVNLLRELRSFDRLIWLRFG